MGALSTNKGKQAERDLVKYLRTVGFGGAERAVRTGYRTTIRTAADPGDVTGTPGIIWSCKDVAAAQAQKPAVLDGWFAELDAMDGVVDHVRLLVHKRSGYASPGRWWCWMRLYVLEHLVLASSSVDAGEGDLTAPVRMELDHVIPLLHAAGYGDAITEESS